MGRRVPEEGGVSAHESRVSAHRVPAGANIVIAGPMGCGKTTVGRGLAKRLDRPFIDTDHLLEAEAGRSVRDVFAEEGEAGFRRRESDVLARVSALQNVVVAVGGGALIDPDNRTLLRRGGVLVGLTAAPEVILKRTESTGKRPLLWGQSSVERLTRIKALLAERLPGLADCDFVLDTSELPISECVAAVIERLNDGVFPEGFSRVGACRGGVATLRVDTASGDAYTVSVGAGLRRDCGRILREVLGIAGPPGPSGASGASGPSTAVASSPANVLLVTNTTVQALYAPEVEDSLREAWFKVSTAAVPDGEEFKTLDTASRLFDFMAERKMSRLNTVVVALGGGVIGDLAGFVAATYGRGVPLVQMPTTLLAQVDAAVGGKVAVNHTAGKNLIGAFHQPSAVIVDTRVLASLPEREFVEGLAEVVKYGVVLDEGFLGYLEENRHQIIARDQDVLREVVLRSLALKASIVREDEKDHGARMVLNFGHTVGHALEAAMGYGALRHGEAVSVGMSVALRLASRLGLVAETDVWRVERLLLEFGLPTTVASVSFDVVLPFLALDKKAVGGRLRLILPEGLGRYVIADDVEVDVLRAAWEAKTAQERGEGGVLS